MFTNEELVKIHNTLIKEPMVEVEEMVMKIRTFFKEEETKKVSEQNGKTE